MRHFHGGHYLTENEKPRAEAARRLVRRFVNRMKRVLILTGTGAALAFIIGCADPVAQIRGEARWITVNGRGCELATNCEAETRYQYGINDCCYPPAMLYACERALDAVQTRADLDRAHEICGQN